MTTLTLNAPPTQVPPTPSAPAPAARHQNAAEWHRALGSVPLDRILFDPIPGTATADDVVRLAEGGEKRKVELVENTLVEKPVGLQESIIAGILITLLNNVVRPQRLGLVSGEAGMIRMLMGNVRMPDVAFFRREDLPEGRLPAEPAPRLAPALAVEVLSAGNTEEEMRIKVADYFQSGVRQVWILDPRPQTLRIYDAPDAPDRFRQLDREEVLQAADLLPGFSARVGELFEV